MTSPGGRSQDLRNLSSALPQSVPGASQSALSLYDYRSTIFAVRSSLERDKEWIDRSSLKKLLFSEVTDTFGPALTRLFDTWPSSTATALAIFAAENLDIEPGTVIFSGLVNAAILADVENPLPYHGNDHYKQVLMQTMCHIHTHNQISPEELRFSSHQAGLILIAAAIHDLCHDGKGNAGQQYRLEQRSFNAAHPYLKAAGLSQDDLADIEAMVLCTDITQINKQDSPAHLLRKCYLHQEGLAELPYLPPELSRLEGRPELVRMAMVVSISDIANSVGLSFSEGWKQTQRLAQETGAPGFKTIDTYVNFVTGDLGSSVVMTPAGARIYGAGFAAIQKECAEKTPLSA
jgi:hypothetical protein